MLRIEVFGLTGSYAKSVRVANRINRRIRRILSLGETVLVDYEHVLFVEDSFFSTALSLDDYRRIKVCGLPPEVRRGFLSRNLKAASETVVP